MGWRAFAAVAVVATAALAAGGLAVTGSREPGAPAPGAVEAEAAAAPTRVVELDAFGFPVADPPGPETCTLTEDQERAAMAAFELMMPVFRHPRCSNCHGGVNPFREDGGHLGGEMSLYWEDGSTALDIAKTERQCTGCHSAVDGWMVPPGDQHFVGKSSEELCRQMKQVGGAEDLLHHMEHDRGRVPFIVEAYTGRRGLDETGITIFEGATEREFRPEPPPGSHAQLVQQTKDWITALGGEIPGEYCGCRLRPHLRITLEELKQGDEQGRCAVGQVWEGRVDVAGDGGLVGEMALMSRTFVCSEATSRGEFTTVKSRGEPGMRCAQPNEEFAERALGMFRHRAGIRGDVVRADTVRFTLTRTERPPPDAPCQNLDAELGEFTTLELPPARYPQDGDVVTLAIPDGTVRMERVPAPLPE